MDEAPTFRGIPIIPDPAGVPRVFVRNGEGYFLMNRDDIPEVRDKLRVTADGLYEVADQSIFAPPKTDRLSEEDLLRYIKHVTDNPVDPDKVAVRLTLEQYRRLVKRLGAAARA